MSFLIIELGDFGGHTTREMTKSLSSQAGISILPLGCESIYQRLPPFAILLCIHSKTKCPVVPGWAISQTKKPATSNSIRQGDVEL
jgi:hypothetical protein